jgi:hypothetical protein
MIEWFNSSPGQQLLSRLPPGRGCLQTPATPAAMADVTTTFL